jgi:hypothetical protein
MTLGNHRHNDPQGLLGALAFCLEQAAFLEGETDGLPASTDQADCLKALKVAADRLGGQPSAVPLKALNTHIIEGALPCGVTDGGRAATPCLVVQGLMDGNPCRKAPCLPHGDAGFIVQLTHGNEVDTLS